MSNEIQDRDDAMRSMTEHVRKVGATLVRAANNLSNRAINHDASKFGEEEWPLFANATHSMKGIEYGTKEYKAELEKIRPAINHHNSVNRHHPEFHKNGIKDMTLLDLIEMLCDWKAASERNKNGSLSQSLEFNKKRFNISDDLYNILIATAKELEILD